jgi:uncharacterized membrane protein YdjX (TVP38/TMEM64 family)
MKPPDSNRSSSAFQWVALAVALVGAVIVISILREPLAAWAANLPEYIRDLGPWGPAFFIAAYVAACVLFLPGSVLTLGAGAAFGPVWGVVWTSIASTLGATAAFLTGRFVAREPIARRIAGDTRFAAIDEAVGREGWKIVLLTRLSPVFPFSLLNYAYGLTRVPTRDYVFASWAGMLPGTVLYVYLGSLGRSVAASKKSPADWAALGAGLIATVAVAVLATRIAKRALKTKLAAAENRTRPV